jgi:HPt (histidine-containing phosphotransfer) domain-containing protein
MDGDEIRQLAHGLKGSSGNLGALQVVDLSNKIEQLARQEQLGGIGQIVDELLNAFERVKKQLNEVVSG